MEPAERTHIKSAGQACEWARECVGSSKHMAGWGQTNDTTCKLPVKLANPTPHPLAHCSIPGCAVMSKLTATEGMHWQRFIIVPAALPVCCVVQDPYRSQLESLLSAHVLPLFQSPHGHLRAKAAWLAKEFADIEFSDGESGSGPLFNALLQAVINGLNDR